MRPILFLTFSLVLITGSEADAGPKKKPPASAPAKKPLAAPSAPAKKPLALPMNPAPSAVEASPAQESSAAPQVRGPTRIDFDDRLIQGQSNKSGAVYLYDRKELKIRSMIKKRENFREEIVGSLYES